jgi:hypothetical protein
MSSTAEALISRVFKRPVLWGNQNKDCHNKDFVDREWRNISHTLKISNKYYYIAFVFGLCTDLFTGMHD